MFSQLFGTGKDSLSPPLKKKRVSEKITKKDKKRTKKREKSFNKAKKHSFDDIKDWLKYFSNPMFISNPGIWKHDEQRKRLNELNDFFHVVILYKTKTFDNYAEKIEKTLQQLTEQATDLALYFDEAFGEDVANAQEKFDDYREERRTDTEYFLDIQLKTIKMGRRNILIDFNLRAFILNFIIMLSEEPEDFEDNFRKFTKIVTNSLEKDVTSKFSDDLDDEELEDLDDEELEDLDDEELADEYEKYYKKKHKDEDEDYKPKPGDDDDDDDYDDE